MKVINILNTLGVVSARICIHRYTPHDVSLHSKVSKCYTHQIPSRSVPAYHYLLAPCNSTLIIQKVVMYQKLSIYTIVTKFTKKHKTIPNNDEDAIKDHKKLRS